MSLLPLNRRRRSFHFVKSSIVSLLLFLVALPVAGQNNFIAQIEGEKLDAFKQYILAEKGSINRIIDLDGSHLVDFHGDQGLKARVRRYKGVLLVSDNPEVQWINPAKTVLLGVSEAELQKDINSKDLSELQWGLESIGAKDTWPQSRGKGVRIAIIDNGIDANHQDISANLNADLSKSFVPTESWGTRAGFGFHHGTHIAGIIAASDDGKGTLGVAPEAELISLKVASDRTGSGDFSWLLEAIVYAAHQQVDIANVGLGVLYAKTGPLAARASEMQQMVDLVGSYANERGVTLIAPAGDDGKDIDNCCLYLPASSPTFIAVSATTPVGWAFDPYVSTDQPSSYSNASMTSVDFAAPGGDILYPGRDYCVIAEMNRPCWTFDLVFSTIADGWGWASGSSMSTAFLSGVAALIHGKEKATNQEEEITPAMMKQLLINHTRPAKLEKENQLAVRTGKDRQYGFGIIHAFKEELIVDHSHKTIEIINGMLSDEQKEHVSPESFELYQNYPNPFNPQTTINFHLAETARVQVTVYDMLGSEVAVLVDQELEKGCYNTSWNGRDEAGRTLKSGVYMYKIDAENFVDSKVMTFANN